MHHKLMGSAVLST